MQHLFYSRVDTVQKKVFTTLNDKMNDLRGELDTRMEDTNHESFKADILSKNNILETKISEKVDNVDLLIFEKIKELSKSLSKREEHIRGKIIEVKDSTTNIMETMKDINSQIDDIQESLYDFEINKKNNLIFME